MNNYNLIKKIGIILTLLVVTSLSSYATSQYTGSMEIDGAWHYDLVLSAGNMVLENGNVIVDSPKSFVGSDGSNSSSYDQKDKLKHKSASKTNAKFLPSIEICSDKGVTVSEKDNFEIEVISLRTGEIIFTSEDANNVVVSKELLMKDNENIGYLLRVKDVNGTVSTLLFNIGENFNLQSKDKMD